MGGTIKMVMSSPDVSGFYGSGETIGSGTQGGGANYGQNAMVNMPSNETTAVRLAGTYMHTSGWIDGVNPFRTCRCRAMAASPVTMF